MRIVFATAEVSPIAKTGGLGDVCGSLPKALVKLGHDVAIFLPFYRQARQWLEKRGVAVQGPLPPQTIAWGGWRTDATFLRTTLPGTEIPLILVANDYFFDREQIYSGGPGFHDELHRYTFFCRAVIRGCELLGIAPDILHCHDWHTALLPLYLDSGLRGGSPPFASTRSVFTIHNLNYQGITAASAFGLTGLHSRYFAPDGLEHFGDLNPMKGALLFSDRITTVSPTYAREIQSSEHGAGLDGILRARAPRLTGILNGIDVDEWNPASDPHLEANFDLASLEKRRENKRALVSEAGLQPSPGKPLIGAVSRLVSQKGFQLLIPILGRLLESGAQLVLLGSGEPDLENALRLAADEHPADCRVSIGFDNELAHRIYAGVDLLLMPSIYEPCGLNQMYALRYGALPIVRLTGGLADTVIPFDGTNANAATGFGFIAPHPLELYQATWLAMIAFQQGDAWNAMQHTGMQIDFSWDRSAEEYDAVYRKA